MESLWCALCTWRHNIRVTINYLARLVHMVGNVPLILQQAKRIAVCFSRSQSTCVVNELIKDLNVRGWVFMLSILLAWLLACLRACLHSHLLSWLVWLWLASFVLCVCCILLKLNLCSVIVCI